MYIHRHTNHKLHVYTILYGIIPKQQAVPNLIMLWFVAIWLLLLASLRVSSSITHVGYLIRPAPPRITGTNITTIAKIALAGGLAGGVATGVLYPIDTIKTMRQSDPSLKSLSTVLKKLREIGISKAYSGFLPSVIGSIPSSAIYFGTYETMKLYFSPLVGIFPRQFVNMLAAGMGNLISSFVFVPKELVKTRLQSMKTSTKDMRAMLQVVRDIYRTAGFKGFYPSYRATVRCLFEYIDMFPSILNKGLLSVSSRKIFRLQSFGFQYMKS